MKRFAIAALFFSVAARICFAQTISIGVSEPGFFAVKAHGGEVSLSNTVEVQQLVDGRWRDGELVDGRWRHADDVKLLPCGVAQREDDRCITLQANEVLVPPPWTGQTCMSQCPRGCRATWSLPPGTFRFAVRSCHGIDIWLGPAFEMLYVTDPYTRRAVVPDQSADAAEPARRRIARSIPSIAPPPSASSASRCAAGVMAASASSRVDCPLSEAQEASLKPRDVFRECDRVCPEMVVVPPGSFVMGSPEDEKGRSDGEGPQHRITIGRAFAVGRFAVTLDEWDACVSEGGCAGYRPPDAGWGRGRRPVNDVSWEDAKRYLTWLSKKTGKEYRLLSEAEWEYVARAGTTTPFWWGTGISHRKANYRGTATRTDRNRSSNGGGTLPVDSFDANPFGLYQVHGDVFEWVEDCWHETYCCSGRPRDGSAWTTGECHRRVLRGGDYWSEPRALRAAARREDTSLSRG
ncbi:MAG: formylglycine-generating enzyme family protein [Alphaproteobacteria bacterium]|nr:formylglycine-generating enzyme family protein [Alphaproteobacteria bacterium]